MPQLAFVAPIFAHDSMVESDVQATGVSMQTGDSEDDTSESSVALPLAAVSAPASDSDAKRSILKRRSVRPPPKPAPRQLFPIFCQRRLPQSSRCAKRKGTRITFKAEVEVVEFSRTIAPDAVPGDDTDLAVGLGRPMLKGFAPLISKKKPGRRIEEHCYIPFGDREKILTQAMGPKRALKVMSKHRRKTQQVMAWREEAKQDPKEPHELMPSSYQEAKERAWKVAAEARAAAAESDSLFGAWGSLALEVSASLALVQPNKLVEPKEMQIEVPAPSSKGISDISPHRRGIHKRKHQLISTDSFMSRSLAGRMARLQKCS
jgi:hypothetical protein